jgi:hypothetical protein
MAGDTRGEVEPLAVEVYVTRLGNEPIILEGISSEEIEDTSVFGDRRMRFIIRATFRGRSTEIEFLDSSAHFRVNRKVFTEENLNEALEKALVEASIVYGIDLPEFKKQHRARNPDIIEKEYRTFQDRYEQMHDLLGITGYDIGDIADELLERWSFFPATGGSLRIIGRDVFDRL